MSDWPDLHILHAVAATGSLAAAGRMLGVRHTTVGRRLDALEAVAGDKLVHRMPRGVVLTPLGTQLADIAAAVDELMVSAGRKVRGETAEIAGTVTIAAAPLVATWVVAAGLAPFLDRNPALTVVVVSSPSIASLVRCEADIALRVGEPSEQSLVSRRLGSVHLGLYATAAVLEMPEDEWRFIGYSETLENLPHHRWFEDFVGQRRVVLRTSDVHAHVEAAASGVGIAMLPCAIADADPKLEKVRNDGPAPRPLWLLVHPEIRRSIAVSAVIDGLVEMFGRDQRFAR